jgi:ATP-dependent Clp protease ATP-binding subunit ClpC
VLERFSPKARNVILAAQTEASTLGHPSVSAAHLFLGAVRVNSDLVTEKLAGRGITLAGLRSALSALVPALDEVPVKFDISDSGHVALRLTLDAADRLEVELVEPEHFLIGTLSARDADLADVLAGFGTTSDALLVELGFEASPGSPAGVAASPTGRPMLERYASDLTAQALAGDLDPVVGRDSVVERLVTVISRRTKSNPVLLGEAGVGKTAVVEALAQRLVGADVPEGLRGRPLFVLDLAALLAGTHYRGDFEERFTKLLEEARACDAILFIDEVHSLLGTGAGRNGGTGASELLKPLLARGELTLVGATTHDEYRAFSADAALERRFQPVKVDALDEAETLEVLRALRPALEAHHGVVLSDAALAAAASMAKRFVPARHLPDSAIDAIDEAGAAAALAQLRSTPSAALVLKDRRQVRAALAAASRDADYIRAAELAAQDAELSQSLSELLEQDPAHVGAEQVAHAVSQASGVSVDLVLGDVSSVSGLPLLLEQRVVGQHQAKAVVVAGARRRRALASSSRPDSYLFVGPTGVGKTELVKALSDSLNGPGALVRLDMSEYGEAHTVSRLLGAPPGFAGYDEPGHLSEPVRRRPHAVILVDEVEKAHPRVFDVFLSILEEGRLTDAGGRVVDFSNTTVVFTSNLGTGTSRTSGFGDTASRQEDAVRRAVSDFFRPEFLNRVDHQVVFSQLESADLRQVASRMLSSLGERLADVGLGLTSTDEALDLIVNAGTDLDLGARPLRRAVTALVEDPLSEMLLRGDLAGASSVNLSVKCGLLDLEPVVAAVLV